MPNYYGDLQKSEIVVRLQRMGYNVKSVRALNPIMEQMGLQKHVGKDWQLTPEGMNYTKDYELVYNPDLWLPQTVDLIAEFLDNNK